MCSEQAPVLYSFPHPLGGPGINNTAWQQVYHLAEHGVPVTVFTTSLRTALPRNVRVVETLALAGHRIPHRAMGVRRAYAYHDWLVAAAVRKSRTQYALVHCWPGSCLKTIAAAHDRNVPTFREAPNAHTATTFEDAAVASQSVGVELPKGASHRSDPRRLQGEQDEFERADFILVPSDYVRQSFLDRGVEPTRLLQHQYGYDPQAFTGARASVDRPFTAVFIGRGEPAKGLHLALQAWRESGMAARGKLLVAGRLLPEYATHLREALADPSVEVLNFVDDVPGLLGRSDVLLLPSYTEGSALVTYEAMATGVIPLVSNRTGAPVKDGVDGFIHQVGDVEAIAGQLGLLARDAALLLRMRSAAIATAASLTWSQAADRLASLYNEGIQRHHRSAS